MPTEPRDPIDSALLTVVFPKSRAAMYATAVALARGAAQYLEHSIEGVPVHMAGFPDAPEDLGRAQALLEALKGCKGVRAFVRGRAVDPDGTAEVLRCYSQARAGADPRAHCELVIFDPTRDEPTDNRKIAVWTFPCRLVWKRGLLDHRHPSSLEDQARAAAVRRGCDWCPAFSMDGLRPVGPAPLATLHRLKPS